MPNDEIDEVSSTPETVELLEKFQRMITDAEMQRDQAMCLVADLMCWVLLCASTEIAEAEAQAKTVFPGIIENIRANGPALEARRRLLAELEEKPQWVN